MSQISLPSDSASTFWHALADFIIRRRILISAVVFLALVAEEMADGVEPRAVFDFADPWSVAGLALVIGGVTLRSWAAGILRKDRELTTTGPYSLIRNPLYVGSFMMMFGFCALLNVEQRVWFLLIPMVILYLVKVRREEQLLGQLFPAEWNNYSRRTPRFVPRPARVSLAADWRLSQWLRSREYQALGASLLALALIEVWSHWGH